MASSTRSSVRWYPSWPSAAATRRCCRAPAAAPTGWSRRRGSRSSARTPTRAASARMAPTPSTRRGRRGATCRRPSCCTRCRAGSAPAWRPTGGDPGVAGKSQDGLLGEPHPHCVVVPSGQQCCPGRRADRSDVEPVVAQPGGGEAVDVRGGDPANRTVRAGRSRRRRAPPSPRSGPRRARRRVGDEAGLGGGQSGGDVLWRSHPLNVATVMTPSPPGVTVGRCWSTPEWILACPSARSRGGPARRGAGVRRVAVSETIHDSLAVSLLAIEHTSWITVRTSVAVAFVRSPTLTAYTTWDLAAYSGGRFAPRHADPPEHRRPLHDAVG